MRGRSEASSYFGNYAREDRWQLVPGLVEGRPAALVFERGAPLASPAYFVLLDWAGDRLSAIRDYRYARYVSHAADIRLLDPALPPTDRV